MASTTPILVPKKAQEGIIEFFRQCSQLTTQSWNLRSQMELVDRAYQREVDWTTENQLAKQANKIGDTGRLQNVTVPIVMPVVENAVTYQASIFLTGKPIFGVVSSPDMADQALQMETVIDQQATQGGWSRELILIFRNAFKYNLAPAEIYWDRVVTAALDNDPQFASGKQGKPKEVIWEGNKVKSLDPYNTFFDSRVIPYEIPQKGEFAGYTELVSRVRLKQFINELPDKMVENVKEAFESGVGFGGGGGFGTGGMASYYIPQINPRALVQKDQQGTNMDWTSWAGLTQADQGIQYKNQYQLTKLYARIIPSDFGLRVPSPNTPQVWLFIIVNHQVLIYAERQTNAHGLIPILFAQPNEDTLAYQTKSTATNVQPMQEVSSALMNSVIAARRRAISDRGLFDPSRVAEAHINSANPAAKIPVRPTAYGKPLGEAYYPIPFRDDQSGLILQEIGQFSNMANQIVGQNPARQGQFVKGNKTLHEYSDVMAHANGRDQLSSILLEDQFFTPMKEILKTNILQFQGGISLYNRDKKKIIKVDPVALRNAVLQMKVADGLNPVEKVLNEDTFNGALQAIAQNPQIGSAYNIGPMFSYLVKSQGADLTPFEKSPEQVSYEQAVQAWQQTVMELSKQGVTPDKYPPQPIPANYGYVPASPGVSTTNSPVQTQTKINNITNNIKNNGDGN